MKNLIFLAGLWGALGLVAGCGKERAGVVDSGGSRGMTSPNGGKNHGGASSGDAGEPSAGAGGGGADDGLSVTITAPTAASDPVEDEVIVDDEVTVLCVVTAGELGEPPNASTVALELLGAAGEAVLGDDNKPVRFPGVPTGETDEYYAKFALAAVPTGVVGFRCSAKGVDASVAGSTTITTFVDHGPTIVEKLPEEGAARPLEQVLEVEFTVTPTPLTDDDTEAEVTGVVLHVAGKEIAASEDQESPGTYRASVDFQDQTIFEEPPTEHTSVRIEATNARSSNPATGVRDYPFVVDGVGPVVTFVKPKDNTPIKGETIVEFTVADSGAGLDTDTLQVTVTGSAKPVKYNADLTSVWLPRKANSFAFRFDTGNLDGIESQISVRVDADDIAGNHADGETLFLYLDDKAPLIDLDPGDARGYDAQDFCSESFDPVGLALNDGDVTDVRLNLIRALIYDNTNHGSGQNVFYMAGTDQATARLYIQPKTAEPFLVDNSGDGVCDSLASEDFAYQTLTAVKKAGNLQYSTTDFAQAPVISQNAQAPNYCKTKGPVTPPAQLCNDASDMSVVIQHDVDTRETEPVMYAMGGLAGFECTGSKWDIKLEGAKDGWVCFAAGASDYLANFGISRPLRICFDDPDTAFHPSCAMGSEEPPTCTTNCVAPPAFPAHIYRY